MASRSSMSDIAGVHNCYLWSMSCIYLFAFSSIYIQIPGLYGDNGVLPVRAFAQLDKRGMSGLAEASKQMPSLVWLGPSLGLSLNTTVELVALLGTVISFLQLIYKPLRNFWTYCLVVGLYFSLYQIGQTFMWFQWDSLLIETGILTALTAPLKLPFLSAKGPQTALTFWLVRWLLFRLMFASGIVKLTSECPTWWSLTALDIHFESQCIPTPLAWFAHHLPTPLLRLSVVMTYIIEIIVPFMFFIPINSLRVFSFLMQVIFQLAIILTGNYNFFNLLTIVLCLSILNDSHASRLISTIATTTTTTTTTSYPRPRFLMPTLLTKLVTYFIYFSLIYWTIQLFNIQFIAGSLTMSIGFTKDQLNQFIIFALPVSIGLATISLAANIFKAISRCLIYPSNSLARIANLLYTTIYTGAVIYFFCISLVPHVSVDTTRSTRLWPVINRWHRTVERYPVVNSYGLFRRMTGVGGRPEIVIEGSNDMSSPSGWKAYHFLYKPGDITKAPQFNIPHQPRLDWQMWFAALDTYQNNPWLLNLCYRLLTAQPEVLDLLDKSRLPFKTAPKFIRVRSYIFRFTGKGAKNWWRRENEKEYMAPVSRESLEPFAKAHGILPESGTGVKLIDKYPFIARWLVSVRQLTAQMSPKNFIYSLLFAALLIAKF
ncbi:lipase maturation factor 2-like [Oppia nitens]|uniref:lipase maturation factor 2-like n=1 Tax=Oppia nitens TaxID=1686743 RepID=UPI0023DB63F3|nr:lipase maturation factor 2-like [Oppia nitens]